MTTIKSCLEPAQVTCPTALPYECASYCKFNLNIGIFFDGTDNHKERDTPSKSHSNIARLSDAYKDEWEEGFFSHYIQGVGTPALENLELMVKTLLKLRPERVASHALFMVCYRY